MFLTVLRYALPTVWSMWVFTLYTLVDGVFVGRAVGELGLGGVTLSMPVVEVFFAFGVLLGVGSSVPAAHAFGGGFESKGNRWLSTGFRLSLTLGVLVGLLGCLFARPLASALGGRGALLEASTSYLQTLAPFAPFFMTGYGLEQACKVDQSPSFPLFAVLCGGVVNIFGDWLFLFCFGWGVRGAALATGLSQVLTFSLLCWRLWARPRRIALSWRARSSWQRMARVPRAGVSEFCVEVSSGFLLFCFNRALLHYLGSESLAAFGVVSYVANLAIMTAIGVGQGTLPLLSELRGAGRGDLARKASLQTLALGLVLGLGFYLFGLTQASWVSRLFLPHQSTDLVSVALKRHGLSFIAWVPNLVFASTLTAFALPGRALCITLARGFVLTPLALFLLPLWGREWFWFSQPLAEVCAWLISLPLYVTALKRVKESEPCV